MKVTPLGKIVEKFRPDSSTDNSITLTDGQMVVITNAIPSVGFQPTSTPPELAQAGLVGTDVPENGGNLPPPGKGGHGALASHPWRNIIIGGAVATGIGVGLGVGWSTGSCKPTVGVSAPSCGTPK